MARQIKVPPGFKVHPSGRFSLDIDGNVAGKFGRVLKPKRQNGYLVVSYYLPPTPIEGEKVRQMYVHRMMAECWIDNPDDLPEVNHKDGDKLNNVASNLEWVTRQDNVLHAIAAGLITNLPKSGQTGFQYT